MEKWTSGIRYTAELIVGQLAEITTIDAYVTPEDNVEEQFKEFFEKHKEDRIIVFTDLMGGSVNQKLMEYAKQDNVTLVTGTNLPVLMQVMLADDDVSEEEIETYIEEARGELQMVQMHAKPKKEADAAAQSQKKAAAVQEKKAAQPANYENSTAKISALRVDDRLIHGEVVTAWTPTFKANKIIIIDDEVAKDTFNVRVVKALAPAGTKVIVYNVEKAAEKLMVQGVPGERLLLLAKTPTTYNRLIKAGVPLKEVNLGGAGIRGERQPFINNVALNPEEVLACEEMQKAGVNVYYQLVPEQSVVKIDDALKKAKDNFGL
mgnify:FL=1